MRQIILDTETTGLELAEGHRLLEIACIEIINRRKTERHFHHYLNPERTIGADAQSVHGIDEAAVQAAPRFGQVARGLIDFVRDAEVIIHNAPFDLGFINAELANLDGEWGQLEDYCAVLDTLTMARELHPGQKNSLDALCERYEVDNAARVQHGALLDAQILLEVYLAMTRSQRALLLDDERKTAGPHAGYQHQRIDRPAALRTIQPTPEELAAHEKLLDNMTVQPLWRR